jgi:metal-responsive CopG/Arc/MetJ family transcriptional regulator
LKFFRRTPPDSSTAFRLPKELLSTIDSICDEMDLTRSQLFRRSVTEFIKSRGHERNVQNPNNAQMAKVEDQKWSPELYDRLQRRR